MIAFCCKRLLAAVPVVLVILTASFGLMHAIPGGPLGVLGENPHSTAEETAKIRASFGLDRPVPLQYVAWLRRVVLHGDLGTSYTTGEPVTAMIADRLPATVELMAATSVLAILLALGVGTLSALKAGTRTDAFIALTTLVIISVPVFWSALMLVMLFSVKLALLPAAGWRSVGEPFSVIDHLRHLVLPTCVLALLLMAGWSRYTRMSVVDAMGKRFFVVARAKGNGHLRAVLRHALPNALPPVLAAIAMNLPLLFTGAIVTETVFAWPGMGRLFYDGLTLLDYSRVMGIVLLSSIMIIVFTLAAEFIHVAIDPRTRDAV